MQHGNDMTPAQRLRVACEMHELGVAMMRQNLRRKHPHVAEEEVKRTLIAWLQNRPGDASGPGLRVVKP